MTAVKEAQLMDALRSAGSSLVERVGQAPDALRGMWQGLTDDQRQAAINALIGAAAGGTTAGGLGLATGEGVGSSLSSALSGALLGGVAGGAGTLGYKHLTGTKLPMEGTGPKRSLTDKGFGAVTDFGVRNWGPLAGAGAAGLLARGKGPMTGQELATWMASKGEGKHPTEIMHRLGKDIDPTRTPMAKVLDDLKKKNPHPRDYTKALRGLAKNQPNLAGGLKGSLLGRKSVALPIGALLGLLGQRHAEGN